MEHPHAGRRPSLVLARQAAVPVLRAVLAVPATRADRDSPPAGRPRSAARARSRPAAPDA
ncbi:MAG TPA: hypothetical protein VFB42_10845 [Gaiellaceae bacterium]|nr:hypothetical protein [Gaiellaceae bacterium]